MKIIKISLCVFAITAANTMQCSVPPASTQSQEKEAGEGVFKPTTKIIVKDSEHVTYCPEVGFLTSRITRDFICKRLPYSDHEQWEYSNKHTIRAWKKDCCDHITESEITVKDATQTKYPTVECLTVEYIPASKKAQRDRLVANVLRDGTIQLKNARTNEITELAADPIVKDSHRSLTKQFIKYLPTTGLLAAVSADIEKTIIHLWDLKSKKIVATFPSIKTFGYFDNLEYIPATDEHPALLAMNGAPQEVQLWDLKTT